ncbi:hypothetical protein, partial [Bacillus sp. JJ1562]|uniref:hypothetical protein n=1 Tax=Bacillus sp. JJ1562 TaxID=3122960 RepID=UPI0030021B9A
MISITLSVIYFINILELLIIQSGSLIITKLIPFFGAILPLSFTVYFFAYKERKDIAYSAFKLKLEKSVITYLLFSILLIICWILWTYSNLLTKYPVKFNLMIVLIAVLWIINIVHVY